MSSNLDEIESTRSDSSDHSIIQYFSALSDDERFELEKVNKNKSQPPLQTKHYNESTSSHCAFWNEKNSCRLETEYPADVVDSALEIASSIEDKHPIIRPYISMYLMKKYFGTPVNHTRYRDHHKCKIH